MGLGTGDLETILVYLIVTVLIAVFVWVGCRAAGRPDWGQMGAAVVVVLGALLTLLAVV